MFDAMFPSHWSRIRKLYWLNKLKNNVATYEVVVGNPVSFTAKAAPLRKLEVAFSPVQSLNGYDSPWPAGGGANIWDEEWEEGSLTWGGGNYGATNKIRSKGYIPVTPETTYYAATPVNIQIFYYDANKTFVSYEPSSLGKRTFTIPANCYYMRFYTYNTDSYPPPYNHDIAINYPSSVTTYSPYSNICPISGWSSLTVEQRGKNLAEISQNTLFPTQSANVNYLANGINVYNTTAGAWRNVQFVIPLSGLNGQVLRFSCDSDGDEKRVVGRFCTADGTNIGSNIFEITSARVDRSVAVPSDLPIGGGLKLIFYCTGSTAINAEATYTNIQLELGSTATDYVPYNPDSRTISINLGSTVYSGYVDVCTGVGEITGKRVEITSADSIHSAGTNPAGYLRIRYIGKGNEFVNHGGGLYNVGTVNTATNAYNYSQPNKAFVETDSIYIMPPATVTTREEYIAWLGEVGTLQAFFSLKDPVTISLTPEQVNSLAGDNTMWTDAASLEVTYRSN